MKFKCPSCDKISSHNVSPGDGEGAFISDGVLDSIPDVVISHAQRVESGSARWHGEGGFREAFTKWIEGNVDNDVVRCPHCNYLELTLRTEGEDDGEQPGS